MALGSALEVALALALSVADAEELSVADEPEELSVEALTVPLAGLGTCVRPLTVVWPSGEGPSGVGPEVTGA